jgi:hypothetical protein
VPRIAKNCQELPRILGGNLVAPLFKKLCVILIGGVRDPPFFMGKRGKVIEFPPFSSKTGFFEDHNPHQTKKIGVIVIAMTKQTNKQLRKLGKVNDAT